jgi:chromate transporter
VSDPERTSDQAPAGPEAPPPSRGAQLWELAALFTRLGLTAFGGPAAHVALMQHEVVDRRGWMSRAELLDLYGATNLIPGPNSTELAIHIGHRRAGFPGLVVAGASFIFPASLVTLAFAWAYTRYGALPRVDAILYGIKPVIIAVVVQALVTLGRTALKSRLLVAVAVAAVGASLLHANEIAVLLGAAAFTALARRRPPPAAAALAPLPLAASTAAAASVGLWPLFLVFLKIGSVLFGSGYVLLAFLRADLVDRLHWMTEAQLLDAVAAGQITPGPVFTTATFIGYLLAGPRGAAAATLGIFLPAFFFVAVSGPLVPRLRRSPAAGAFLDGLNAASLALMAVVVLQLARAAVVDVPTAVLAALGAGVLVRYKNVSSLWLVLGGAIAGTAIHALR